jgi:cell division septal protein FtsQ
MVSVSRNWINKKVSIAVIERVAVAKALTSENSMVNFDISGAVFKPISREQILGQESLPIVSTAGDSKADLSGVVKLLQQLPENLQYLIEDLQQISVTKSGDILMKTRINQLSVEINWGGVQQLDQKYSILIALLKLPENNEIRQVDLSEPSAPVVK